jgi:hypothetical protein
MDLMDPHRTAVTAMPERASGAAPSLFIFFLADYA